jgi:hypothetical protein
MSNRYAAVIAVAVLLGTAYLSTDAACAQEAAETERSPADPILGAPLVIHDVVVPFAEIKKAIVLGGRGQTVLGLAKLQVWADEEVARRMAAGAEAVVVTDEDVEEAIQEQEAQLKDEYPNGEVTLRDLVPEPEKLHDRLKTIELFNRLFLPEDPSEFPQITIDALSATDVGQALLKELQGTDKAQETEEVQGAELQGVEVQNSGRNPLLEGVLFEEVMKYLEATSDVVEGEDLPVELALRVNGKDVCVEDLWTEIAPTISEVDVRKAKQWIVNMRLLREDLERAGLWLTPEQALAKYKEHSDPYVGGMLSQENIALAFKKFPSLRAYRDFRHAYDSFRQKIQSELTPENLKAFADRRTRALIGQCLVDVDVILLSAYDFKGQRWKPDGWAEARRRAQETSKAIAADPAQWDQILDANSDFYDQPIAASQQGQEIERNNKGRFRGRTRNPLMSALEESEYWNFLNGKTITDFVCFEQTVGTIANPIRGPYGYYIPRLLRRTSAPPSATLSEEDLLEMADQDYTMYRMTEYAQELIRKNEVYGLE